MPSLSLSLIIVDIAIITGLVILVIGPYRCWYNFKKIFQRRKTVKSLS